jgi:hypothetical protein
MPGASGNPLVTCATPDDGWYNEDIRRMMMNPSETQLTMYSYYYDLFCFNNITFI